MSDQHQKQAWYCESCGQIVPSRDVTFSETHDPRAGGCGEPVEVIEVGVDVDATDTK